MSNEFLQDFPLPVFGNLPASKLSSTIARITAAIEAGIERGRATRERSKRYASAHGLASYTCDHALLDVMTFWRDEAWHIEGKPYWNPYSGSLVW